MIEIRLNGEVRSVESQSVESLIDELRLTDRQIAVELNKEVVPRSAFQTTALHSGDQIEIIHFVGGG